jgi:hypothetical protein
MLWGIMFTCKNDTETWISMHAVEAVPESGLESRKHNESYVL